MKSALSILLKIIMFIWQFPQFILGDIVSKFYSNSINTNISKYYSNIEIKLSNKLHGGVCFGNKIILSNLKLLSHELGHSRQSAILGPLYLLVICLPSLLNAGVFNSFDCHGNPNKRYFDFYTEWLLFPKDSLQEYQKIKK